jgi:hypothetical protein
MLLPTHNKSIVNGHHINAALPSSPNGNGSNSSQHNKNYSCGKALDSLKPHSIAFSQTLLQIESSSNASSCNSSGPNSPNHIKPPNNKYPTQFPLTTSSSISNQLNEQSNNQFYPNMTHSASATQSSSSNLTTPHSLKPKSEFFPTSDPANDNDHIAQSLRDNLKLAIEKKNNANDDNFENLSETYPSAADLNDSFDDVQQTASVSLTTIWTKGRPKFLQVSFSLQVRSEPQRWVCANKLRGDHNQRRTGPWAFQQSLQVL